jgi:hypothetical protein
MTGDSRGRALRRSACTYLLAAIATTTIAASFPASSASDTEQIDEVVHTWAQSWDRGDVSQYLDQYASDFIPAGGLTRTQWEQQRRTRLKTSAIRHVMLRDLQVDVASNVAQAQFTQHYLDMDLISTARKRLTLVKQAGTWKIHEEQIEAERAVRR